MVYRSRRIEFSNRAGHALAAALELPPLAPRAYALFAHCFTCSKDVVAASRISRGLRARGIAVLRFDFTGLGGSEGDFATTDFSSNVSDLVDAAAYLRAEHEAPRIVVGHSLGGAAALVAARELSEVELVATVGAPSDPAHLRELLREDAATIEREGEATVDIGGRPFRIRKQLLDDLAAHDLPASVGRLGKRLVVFHAPGDAVVDVAHAHRIFDAAAQPKSFVSLDGADHLLSRPEDSEYVAATLALHCDRLLGGPDAAAALEHGHVEVAESGLRFVQEVRAGRHVYAADEPRESGGDDFGPNPYDFLLSALGACTTMTLRMYAKHKQWPLDRARVALRHGRIHAEDCEDCESQTGRVDVIERTLTLDGDLTEEQRQRILEIADRCPVHRTLTGEIKVRTRLGE